jgi:hypothetical protein
MTGELVIKKIASPRLKPKDDHKGKWYKKARLKL